LNNVGTFYRKKYRDEISQMTKSLTGNFIEGIFNKKIIRFDSTLGIRIFIDREEICF